MAFFSRRGNGGGRKLRKSLDSDMRALDQLANDHLSDGMFDMRGYAQAAFEQERTRDIAYLAGHGRDGREFHARELAPNWTEQTREQRASKIASFVRFANLLEHAPEGGHELHATVRTKVALLACAYDVVYADSYRRRIARHPEGFGEYELSKSLAGH